MKIYRVEGEGNPQFRTETAIIYADFRLFQEPKDMIVQIKIVIAQIRTALLPFILEPFAILGL